MIEKEEPSEELERVIASLNQLLSHDYVELGSAPNSIEAVFEVALGLRQPAALSASMPLRSYDAIELYDAMESIEVSELPVFSRTKAKQEWSISLTDEFVKNTTGIDRKLQGRILEALLDLVKAPMESRGNSCKPLVGNLAGLWRLRIGDTRLVYKPDPTRNTIYCLAFTSRGDAYR